MSNTENLQGQGALKKIKEIAEGAGTCFLLTNLSEKPLTARPMSTVKIDDQGYIWFFTKKDGEPASDIRTDDRVQLLYSHHGSSEYLSLYGSAETTTDRKKIEELWSPIMKTWFNEGKEDPSIVLLKVSPSEGHYWDTKSNRLVQMVKIVAGAIAGKPTDDGIQGQVSL